MLGSRILQSPSRLRSKPLKQLANPGIVENPVATGEHQQRRADDTGHRLVELSIQVLIGQQETNGHVSQRQWVVADEPLPIQVPRKKSRILQRNLDQLVTDLQPPGQPQPKPRPPTRTDSGSEPRVQQRQGVDQVGTPRRHDRRQLATPADGLENHRAVRILLVAAMTSLGQELRHVVHQPICVQRIATRVGVASRTATVQKTDFEPRFRQPATRSLVPPRVTLDPVQRHHVTPHRRPHRRPPLPGQTATVRDNHLVVLGLDPHLANQSSLPGPASTLRSRRH